MKKPTGVKHRNAILAAEVYKTACLRNREPTEVKITGRRKRRCRRIVRGKPNAPALH